MRTGSLGSKYLPQSLRDYHEVLHRYIKRFDVVNEIKYIISKTILIISLFSLDVLESNIFVLYV